ncbi:hypothetical protein [Litoribrevibacter albus]|uniref:Chemotaxis protein n=1 Tax=Litoribrevibacter albus TaxID=1473156 RepID=A0AA37W6S6_9GAMM|nr:hypothetical protein [Litoribrevibacter albus]GLQ31915.1 hypothetical protein GCM10007876_23940 [Litoribrevibacter albus]
MLNQEQLEATIKMLALAVAQIEATMIEAGQSVTELSSSFSEIAENFHHLDGHDAETVIRVDRRDFSNLREKLNRAIIAMQFYDRMTQRLHHVNTGLTDTANLLGDPSNISDQDWNDLQNSIKQRYTMESERKMFEQIVSGISLDEALEAFKQITSSTLAEPQDDIELF